jgi:hypothetical protein
LVEEVPDIFQQLPFPILIENNCRDVSYIRHYAPFPDTILVLIERCLPWISFEYSIQHSVSSSLRIRGDLLKQETMTSSRLLNSLDRYSRRNTSR